jgi:hypothetical protein
MKRILLLLLLTLSTVTGFSQVVINSYAYSTSSLPENTVLPVISGTSQIDETLSVTTGTWTNSPTSYSYQWKRNGSDILGATSSTYQTKIEDGSTTLTCTVTATNASGSASATSAGTAITTQFPFTMYADIGFWIDTSNSKTMFNATSTTELVDEAVTGNNVGMIFDRSQNAHALRSSVSSGLLPTLQDAGGVRNSYLQFNAGNSQRQSVLNSTAAFNRIHSGSSAWCVMMWVNFTAGNSSERTIMSNNNRSTASIGFSIARNASNKLTAAATNGSGNIWTVTSTNNFNVTNGWQPVILYGSGVGTNTGRLIIGSFEDTQFNISAGTTANASGSLFIGTRSALTEFFPGQLGDVIFLNRIPTSDEITSFKAYNPARKSISFSPILHTWYDYNDTNYLFSDASGTTPVTNGDAVRVVKNKVSENFGDNLRRQTSVDVASSPVFRASVINSRAAIEFAGGGDNLDFESTLCNWLGGNWVMVLIGKNDDAVNGSHFLRGGDQYITLTGSTYSTGAHTNPYWAVHPMPVGSVAIGLTAKNQLTDDWKILVVKRAGRNFTIYNGDKATATDVTGNPLSFADMGIDDFASDNWDLDGYVGVLKVWVGEMNTAEIEALIDEFNTTYGL